MAKYGHVKEVVLCVTEMVTRLISIHGMHGLCKEGYHATNQDNGKYQFSHTYNHFLDTAFSNRVRPSLAMSGLL